MASNVSLYHEHLHQRLNSYDLVTGVTLIDDIKTVIINSQSKQLDNSYSYLNKLTYEDYKMERWLPFRVIRFLIMTDYYRSVTYYRKPSNLLGDRLPVWRVMVSNINARVWLISLEETNVGGYDKYSTFC